MIRIANVSRNYGTVRAVQDISLEIGRGEIVGLLGHNGAGKTTLMKMLTGYLEPSQGSITVGGVDVVEDRQSVQRQIGYLPESAPLYPDMLVQEYLQMMAALRGVPHEKQPQAVARAVSATGLETHVVSPISTLSKGFRQRVGIAQAILHEPDVLILDEPTNGLDPAQIQSIRGLIRRLGDSTTVLLSTHILQEVEAVCDRVLVLIDGTLAEDSPLKDLINSSTIKVSVLEGTTGIERSLGGLDGVRKTYKLGSDPVLSGFDQWAVDCDAETSRSPEILAAAIKAGWTIGAITPETLTLERVFQRLQREHIARSAS
jgi:ABC-2 type transport system ATP-binding protein